MEFMYGRNIPNINCLGFVRSIPPGVYVARHMPCDL